MKFPLLTSFCGGLVIFAGCGYVGYRVAARTVYHRQQSTWFSSLGRQEADHLRQTGQAAFAYTLSVLSIQNTSSSLQNNVSSLGKIRASAPEELGPIIDLRLAMDYAMMARLEQQADNAVAAAGHKQQAQELLHSLGWKDVSDQLLTVLADRQLKSRVKR